MLPDRYMLTIDGWIDAPEKWESAAALSSFLQQVAKQAGMRVLNVLTCDVGGTLGDTGRFVDEGGMSALALISTSHITIHVWPRDRFAMFDLVSCKAFDVPRLEGFVREVLGMRRVKRIVRGDNQTVTHVPDGCDCVATAAGGGERGPV